VWRWGQIASRAPQLEATMSRYLAQIAVSSRPGTVEAADLCLRCFAQHVCETDPACRRVADVERRHVESYKLALAQRPGKDPTRPIAVATVRHKLGMLRTFFERVIDWGYDDAPRRVPVFAGDLPRADEPLPKFLDDPTAARFMAALARDPNLRRRLIVELLARTGMRVGELGALRDDAVFRLSGTHWLRIPVGKLHNDRTVPLHPVVVDLVHEYQATRGPSPTGLLVVRNDGQPFDRRTIYRYVAAVARRAGTGHVHPHQLRHTLATQCINRGMSLEAIAALLGHRSPRMTLVYARISDDTVAEQYFAATRAVESVGSRRRREPADALAGGPRRLLGNGHCARPAQLDCAHQTICEGCGFFETGPQFIPVLRRQRHSAEELADVERARIFNELIDGLTTNPPAPQVHPS
jgi:integrase